jgi:hypothetical protein
MIFTDPSTTPGGEEGRNPSPGFIGGGRKNLEQL